MSAESRLSVVVLCACLSACDEGTTPDDGGDLQVADSFTLPVAEVSGLALRTVGGARELCAVADGSPFLVIADVAADGQLGTTRQIDVRDVVGEDATKQWEGVAADGTGNLFIVQETGRVVGLGPGLDELLGFIDLPPTESNSGAEGLLLLANGHLLVVHEKDPVTLVELGPAGAESEGIHADLFEPSTFPLPELSTFFELGTWTVAFDDVSDVAVLDGRLYVVSDESRSIGEIELPLSGSGEAPLLSRWQLPAEIDKAEGLAFLDGGRVIVGRDRPEGDPNVFVLDALE
jgi:uncharacterized protein YjiK